MKKFMGNIGFVFLCIVLFLISGGIAFLVTMRSISEAPYRYLKVKADLSVWKVVYDLESDGRTSTGYDLYLPVQADPDKSYSMILFIHGGGFTTGDKEDGKYICPYYASKGMVAVSANYSLTSEENPVDLNVMYNELKNTVQSVKEYCDVQGYSVTEMAVSGISAGGALAMLLAYREPESLAVPVRFVFEQSGPVSFEPAGWGAQDAAGCAEFVTRMSGKVFTAQDVGTESYQQAIDEISPAALVNENTVPTIAAYGPRDIIVPPDIKYSLLEKLKEYGVAHEYLEFPNSGHGLLHDPDKSEEFYRTVDEYIEKYFENK